MAYINVNTWEVCHANNRTGFGEDCFDVDPYGDDYFEVDEFIAFAVAELNKKGYKTIFSCSGHVFPELIDTQMLSGSKCTISGVVYEVAEDGEPLTVFDELDLHSPYVAFSKIYDFKQLPPGFRANQKTLAGKGEVTVIEADYKSCPGTIERMVEITTVMKNLFAWAKNLKELGHQLVE